MTEQEEHIGRRLEEAMRARKVKGTALCYELHMYHSAISRVIHGEQHLRSDQLIKIANRLNISIDWLLGLSDQVEIPDEHRLPKQ